MWSTSRPSQKSLTPYRAVVFWLQDPVAVRTPRALPLCNAICDRCRQLSIPVINPPHALPESERTRAYAHLTAAA